MSARTLRFLAIPGVALALVLAAPAARAQGPSRSGVDLTAMDGSVLTRDGVLGDGVPGLALPSGFGNGSFPLPNETSALSWNLQTLLVLWSGDFDPEDPYALFDPSDPATSLDEGKCSFRQPQSCSVVQALFGVGSPPPHRPAVVRRPALGSVRGAAAASASGVRGVPVAPPSRSPAWEIPPRVDPQLPLRPSVPPEGGDPGAPVGVFDPDDPRAGGKGSFGRRDFVWRRPTPPGCLPPRSGVSGLTASRIEASAWRARARRPGRCPPR